MNNEPVSFLTDNAFSKLLERPLSRRMSRDVKVKDAPRSDFHDDERIDQLECRGHDDEEIAGDDGFGVIAHERHPALGRVDRTIRILRHVAPNRPWRDLNSDLQ